jgi:hypothetical protein
VTGVLVDVRARSTMSWGIAATIAEQSADSIDIDLARDRDAQGIGGPTRTREEEQHAATS